MNCQDEYSKRMCETDAAWDAFCANPSTGNWELYAIAKKDEDFAKGMLNQVDSVGQATVTTDDSGTCITTVGGEL